MEWRFSVILGSVLTWLVTLLPPYKQLMYVEVKNGNTPNEPAVDIRMCAKIKPIAIPTARVHINVLPTGDINRNKIIKSTFQAQWLLYLPHRSTFKKSALSHTTFSMYFTTAKINTTYHFPKRYWLISLWNTYAASFLWGKFHPKTNHDGSEGE